MLGRNTPLTQKVAGTEKNPASKEHQVLQVLPDQLPCEERKKPKPASWKKTAVFIKEQVSARKLRMGLFAQASSHPSSWYFQDVIRGTFSTNTNAHLAFVPCLTEMGQTGITSCSNMELLRGKREISSCSGCKGLIQTQMHGTIHRPKEDHPPPSMGDEHSWTPRQGAVCSAVSTVSRGVVLMSWFCPYFVSPRCSAPSSRFRPTTVWQKPGHKPAKEQPSRNEDKALGGFDGRQAELPSV